LFSHVLRHLSEALDAVRKRVELYQSKAWARRFFDKWKQSLKYKKLPSYEKFAELVERNWDGIAAYCGFKRPLSLGFVEGLNNKIRGITRRCYGIRERNYLRLNILTTNLPSIH